MFWGGQYQSQCVYSTAGTTKDCSTTGGNPGTVTECDWPPSPKSEVAVVVLVVKLIVSHTFTQACMCIICVYYLCVSLHSCVRDCA